MTGGVEGFRTIAAENAVLAFQGASTALFKDLDAQTLPYPTVSHFELTKRALLPKKPFVESGRGYRDALIWYSLLELLKSTSDEVVFVSQNSKDWTDSRKCQFHPDFLSELNDEGVQRGRLIIVPSLAEFNRKYTVSELPVEAPSEKPSIDYKQLLVDGTELIATQLLVTAPDLLLDDTITVLEVGVVGIGSPTNIRSEPPRTLDNKRRLLQFGADYRVAFELVLTVNQVTNWLKRFPSAAVSMQQNLGDGFVRLYVNLSVRAIFRMIERGENTEQFSLASAEIINTAS